MADEGSPKQKRHRILGCLGLLCVMVVCFAAGIALSDRVRGALGQWTLNPRDVAPNSPENPYDIRVIVQPNEKSGKLEVFVMDTQTGKARRLDSQLRAGAEEVLNAQWDALLKRLPGKTREVVENTIGKIKKEESEKAEAEGKEKTAAEKEKKPAPEKTEKPEPKPE